MSDQMRQQDIGEQSGAQAPAKPRTRRQPAKSPPRTLPPWKVILHNDDVNSMDDVVRIVRQLTYLTKQEAVTRTLEAHQSGVALLLMTHQERAELYVEQFASMGLTTTCESDA